MGKFRISGVPITRGKKLVGILTNRDLRFETDDSRRIEEVMTSENLITAPVGTTLEEAKKILEENQEYIGFKAIEMNTQVAKVSIVGAGMVNNFGVASRMFEALSSAGININMISTSEIKVSVLVNE